MKCRETGNGGNLRGKTFWTPVCDQYTINTISSTQVMRIKKNIDKGIISWPNTKFSKLTSQELYGRQ